MAILVGGIPAVASKVRGSRVGVFVLLIQLLHRLCLDDGGGHLEIEGRKYKKPRRKEKQEAKEASAREMLTEKASAAAGGQLNAERSKEKMAAGTSGDKLAAESSGSCDKHESRRERQDRESKRRRKYERSGPDRPDRPRREKDRLHRDAPDHMHKEADSNVS